MTSYPSHYGLWYGNLFANTIYKTMQKRFEVTTVRQWVVIAPFLPIEIHSSFNFWMPSLPGGPMVSTIVCIHITYIIETFSPTHVKTIQFQFH